MRIRKRRIRRLMGKEKIRRRENMNRIGDFMSRIERGDKVYKII